MDKQKNVHMIMVMMMILIYEVLNNFQQAKNFIKNS